MNDDEFVLLTGDSAPEGTVIVRPRKRTDAFAWTEEIVEARILAAYRVIRESEGRVGPKVFGNGWPAIMREFSDYVDAESWKNESAARNQVYVPPSAHALSLMAEAMCWPAQFLANNPARADALTLWALSKVSKVKLKTICQRRAQRIYDMIAKQPIDRGGWPCPETFAVMRRRMYPNKVVHWHEIDRYRKAALKQIVQGLKRGRVLVR